MSLSLRIHMENLSLSRDVSSVFPETFARLTFSRIQCMEALSFPYEFSNVRSYAILMRRLFRNDNTQMPSVYRNALHAASAEISVQILCDTLCRKKITCWNECFCDFSKRILLRMHLRKCDRHETFL